MLNRLSQKQQTFALSLFKGMTQRDAYIDAYHPTYALSAIDANASVLANKQKILARLEELREAVKSEAIAEVQERQEILSDIARGNLLDYQEIGADGAWLDIGKDSPHTKAIAEITSRTDEKNSVVTKVKLHNPVPAIDLLNKMDKLYSEGGRTYNDIKVLIVREKLKEGDDGQKGADKDTG